MSVYNNFSIISGLVASIILSILRVNYDYDTNPIKSFMYLLFNGNFTE